MDIPNDAKHELRLDFLQDMLALTMGVLIAQTGGVDAGRFDELQRKPEPVDGLDEKKLAALTYIRGVRREFFERVANHATSLQESLKT